ncbi:hypothetical protein PoB_006559800 [Plakobranchus ocellatus]|uniref:Uncharacterized protein n=1 Tax=Plakobranchus ocellatus TaxID=259542 RepID=A0AAV4D4L4_9GAST|nr:hypothetical protein PoB_006559800 [Plakobranchus ocellatus]
MRSEKKHRRSVNALAVNTSRVSAFIELVCFINAPVCRGVAECGRHKSATPRLKLLPVARFSAPVGHSVSPDCAVITAATFTSRLSRAE